MVAQLIRSFVTPRTGQEKPKDLKISKSKYREKQ